MQLGFLGTQHFEMLDTVDDERVELLKCWSSTRYGAIQTRSEGHLEPLQQQLVAVVGSELGPKTQMKFSALAFQSTQTA